MVRGRRILILETLVAYIEYGGVDVLEKYTGSLVIVAGGERILIFANNELREVSIILCSLMYHVSCTKFPCVYMANCRTRC